MDNKRIGRFTSSNAYKLMANGRAKDSIGAPFYTYVQEKKYERDLGRSLDTGVITKTLSWGLFMELYLIKNVLDFMYKLVSSITAIHPDYEFWAGTPDTFRAEYVDGVPEDIIGDIKAYEPLNFCKYAEVLQQKSIPLFRKEFPKEYWQLVSNSCIFKTRKAEAILYMPYQKDLESIRNFAATYDKDDQWRYRYIYESEDESLPYVNNDSDMLDMYKFEFEVPKEDKEALENRVLLAESVLRERGGKPIAKITT
jgi:hypothetical protein